MPEEKASRRSIGARRNPETEAAILDAALSILAEQGPKKLTMEAVARRARAGKATLYRWWPNRGALLLSVYERLKGDHDLPDTGAFETDLAEFFRRLFGFWRGPGGVFALIIAEAQSDRDVAAALDAYGAERLEALEALVERAAQRQELGDDAPVGEIAEAITAFIWYRLLTGRLDGDPADMARQISAPWLARH